jgi:hypothetical protein
MQTALTEERTSSAALPDLLQADVLEIPEVWIYRNGALQFYHLRDDRSGYDLHSSSRFAPRLDLALLYRSLAIDNWNLARKAVRAGLGT